MRVTRQVGGTGEGLRFRYIRLLVSILSGRCLAGEGNRLFFGTDYRAPAQGGDWPLPNCLSLSPRSVRGLRCSQQTAPAPPPPDVLPPWAPAARVAAHAAGQGRDKGGMLHLCDTAPSDRNGRWSAAELLAVRWSAAEADAAVAVAGGEASGGAVEQTLLPAPAASAQQLKHTH